MLYSQYISHEREEFDREFKTLATLHHPNIMTFFGMSRDAENQILYNVCEYCGGGTLQSFMMKYKDFKEGSQFEKYSKDSPLSMFYTPKKFNDVVVGILEGVRYMHANGFAHRDLKPMNILMTVDGRIKLCDMGIVVRAAQVFF
jgi:serine/threonine protein kinase